MITYHHIGGRNGTYPMQLEKSPILKDFHLVLYDADAECCGQLYEKDKQVLGKTSIFPYCLFSHECTRTFRLNYHPTTSSLYETNTEYNDYNFIPEGKQYGEYKVKDSFKTVREVDLKCYSLQQVLKLENINEIDFLSLDVQGAEYDILQGSKDLISTHCLGIILEVEFAELYKGQKTFAPIDSLLNDMGFELLDLVSIGRFSPNSLPVGFRGKGQLIFADAVYIKKFSRLVKENANIESMYKWALFALINHNMGGCLNALKHISTLDDGAYQVNSAYYITFLKKLWDIYQLDGDCYLPIFSELFSEAMLSSYYANNGITDAYLAEKIRNDQALLIKYADQFPKIKKIAEKEKTDIECLLKEYGLKDLAETIKVNRQSEASQFMNIILSLSKSSLINEEK